MKARRAAVVKPAKPAAIAWDALARAAEAARTRAHAPYSRYHVGAALLAADAAGASAIYAGCNVENAAYPLCVCAERNAVAAAVLANARDLRAIAVATPGPEAGAPCGGCRQVLAEFATDLPIGLVVGGKVVARTTLRALLPMAFGGATLAASQGKPAARRPAIRKTRA